MPTFYVDLYFYNSFNFGLMRSVWLSIAAIIMVTIFFVVIHEYNTRGIGLTNIGFKKEVFLDRARGRQLKVLLWYPANHTLGDTSTQEGPWVRAPVAYDAPLDLRGKDKYPLLILSHGFSGSPGDQSWIAEAMVARGYIVCGVKHPDMNPETQQITPSWHRPLDVSFVLNELLYSDFGPYIDQDRVGFIGFSMGGLTGIWLAGGISTLFDPDNLYPTKDFVHNFSYFKYLKGVEWKEFEHFRKNYRDPRIKACFFMSPGWGWVFSKEGLERIKVPIQIVSPEEDNLIVSETNAIRYSNLIPTSNLYLFNGKMSHYIFLNSILDERIPEYDPIGQKRHLYENLPGISRDQVHEKAVNIASEFFARTLG